MRELHEILAELDARGEQFKLEVDGKTPGTLFCDGFIQSCSKFHDIKELWDAYPGDKSDVDKVVSSWEFSEWLQTNTAYVHWGDFLEATLKFKGKTSKVRI